MRRWFLELRDFGVALVNRWGQLMTGGVIIAAVTFYRDALGNNVTTAFNLTLAVLFFGLAAFGAWRDKKHALEGAAVQHLNELEEKDQIIARHELALQREITIRTFGNSYDPLVQEGSKLMQLAGLPDGYFAWQAGNIRAWQQRVTERLWSEVATKKVLIYEDIVNPEGNSAVYDKAALVRRECKKLPEQVEYLRQIVLHPKEFFRG